MRTKFILVIASLMSVAMVSAQGTFEPLPQLTSPEKVHVVDVGKFTQYLGQYIETDTETGKQDTTYQAVPEIVWQSEGEDISMQTNAPRHVAPIHMTGTLNGFFKNVQFYVFKYTYESIDAEGNPVTLSSIAATPDPSDVSKVNNVLIGTHITITADWERPSNQTNGLSADSDWGPIFAMSAGKPTSSGTTVSVVRGVLGVLSLGLSELAWGTTDIVREIKYNKYRHNFVVMPDYEGYGETSGRAHPYLYQELTARQVADATQAAIYAYQHDPELSSISLQFEDDWKTVICGYSQGGSVAMATQRFMEQNHIDDTFRLVGSICGDGPYDPMSTLMYYIEKDRQNEKMSMAVVLPLIIKGMLDTNPYMRTHKAEDYFNTKFVETGIMSWLNGKQMSTGDIENGFIRMYNEGKDGDPTYFRDIFDQEGRALMRNIMNEECYRYFGNIYDNYKNTYKTAAGIPLPATRGVMEDLHFALASNDMTDGWTPRHTILLFHSNTDKVVPYDNAERAVAKLGGWAVLHTAELGHDHGDSGKDFFAGDSNAGIFINDNLRITYAMKTLLDLPYSGQTTSSVTSW